MSRLAIKDQLSTLQAVQCFVNCDWDGFCLAKGTHACKVVRFQGLLNVLYIIWDTLREESDCLFKVPRLVGIQAEMDGWSECITHRRYTLDLFLNGKCFQLHTTIAILPSLLRRHQCSPSRACTDNSH